MTGTEYALGAFALFILIMLGFAVLMLRTARKQVEKINAELAERDAQWPDNTGHPWDLGPP